MNSALIFVFACSLLSPVSAFAVDTPAALDIPKELASIEKSFAGKTQKPVVFYIQDAHANFEAQENIAKLIDFLVKRRGVSRVFSEGFEGPSKLEQIFENVDSARREQAARFFMDYLRLSGTQYAFLNRSQDFRLIGVEKLGDYLADLEAYRLGAENQEAIQEDLESISKELRVLANKIYPKEIKEWQRLEERLESKSLTLADYLFRAMKLAPLTPGDYPHLGLVAEYLTKNKLSPEEVQALNAKLETVDSRVFFGELGQFKKDFTDKFLTNETARKTFEYERAIVLFEKLTRHLLTSEEYAELETNFKNLGTQEIADFLALHLKHSVVLSGQWEQLLAGQRKFYELALKRDGNFTEAISSALSGPQPLVLVTGGFHKEGVTRFLEAKKVSYVVLSPKFHGVDILHEKRYDFLMTGGYYPFEKKFFSAHASAQQPTLEVLPEESATALVTTASRSLDASGNTDVRLIDVYSKIAAVDRAVAQTRGASLGEDNAPQNREVGLDFQVKSSAVNPAEIAYAIQKFAATHPDYEISVTRPERTQTAGGDRLDELLPLFRGAPVKSFSVTIRGKKVRVVADHLVAFLSEVEDRNDSAGSIQLSERAEGASLGQKLTPEEVVEARAVDLYVLNRELIALFAEYKSAKDQNNAAQMQAILAELNQHSSSLDPYIDEIRGENPQNQAILDSFSKKSPSELKKLSLELRDRIEGFAPQFIQAQAARDQKTLERLNGEIVPLLKQRLKVQLLRIRYELAQPTIVARQSPTSLILWSAVSIYHRIFYEYWWRSRRARGDEKISRFLMGDATGRLIFNLYYERKPVLRIERDGEDFYLTQTIWKKVPVEDGKPALMPVPTRLKFEEESTFNQLEKALRSRLHVIVNQEEDYRQLIYHDIALEDVRRVLQGAQNQGALAKVVQEELTASLEDVLKGPKGKNGLGLKKVRLLDAKRNPIPMPKENLEAAIRLINANDFKAASDLVESTRQWIRVRLTDIENKKTGTVRKRDYVYLLIRDSAAIQAFEGVLSACQMPLSLEKLEAVQLQLRTVEENYFKTVIQERDYQYSQYELRRISAALNSLIQEVHRRPGRPDAPGRIGLAKVAQTALNRLEDMVQAKLSTEERVIYQVGKIFRRISEFEELASADKPLDLKSELGRSLLQKIVQSFEMARIQIENKLLFDIGNKPAGFARAKTYVGEVSKALYQLSKVLEGTRRPGTLKEWMDQRVSAPKSLADIEKNLILTRLSMENPSASSGEIDALFVKHGAQLAQKMSGRSLGETPEKAKGSNLAEAPKTSKEVPSGTPRSQEHSDTVTNRVFRVRDGASNIKLANLPANIELVLRPFQQLKVSITNLDIQGKDVAVDARDQALVRLLGIQKGTRFKISFTGRDTAKLEEDLAKYFNEFADAVPVAGASLGERGVDSGVIAKTIQELERNPAILAIGLDEYLAVSSAVQEEILKHFVADRIKLILTDAGDGSHIPTNLRIELERKLTRARMLEGDLNSGIVNNLRSENFTRRDQTIVHLSQRLASPSSLEKSLGSSRKQFLFVKQEGLEAGTLTTAILLAADHETYQRFFRRDASGFWVLSEFYELIKNIIQSFVGSQRLAQAA